MPHEVFISYSTRDKTIADAVCHKLESNDIRCWYAPRDIQPGLSWTAAIMDGIAQCRVMVLIWSSHSKMSPDVILEVQHAFRRRATVIPLRVEDVAWPRELAYYMESVHWLEALTPPLEQHLESMLKTVRAVLDSSSPTLAQPDRPEPAAPPAFAPTAVLNVSPDGPGDYRTINQAVQSAPAGARIAIRPGKYRESVLIAKNIEIAGNGPVNQIVIESEGSCFVVTADGGALRGVTLRPTANQKKLPCLDLQAGEFVVDGCDIASPSHAGVVIRSGANPHLQRTVIHDCAIAGILVLHDGRGIIEDCDISASAIGIGVTGGDPVVRGSRIHDCLGIGIAVDNDSKGTFENCDIFGNMKSQVNVVGNARPVLRHCRIHDGKDTGAIIEQDAAGVFEDCDFFANTLAAIQVNSGGNPVLRRCKIHDGGQTGVLVLPGGKGTAEDCEFWGNAFAAFAVKGGNPIVRQCRMNDGKSAGILVFEEGKGLFEECEVAGNAEFGVAVLGGTPVIRHCRVSGGGVSGIVVKGRPEFEDCDVFRNNGSGLLVETPGAVIAKRCKFRENKKSGILLTPQTTGEFEDCEVLRNAEIGVNIGAPAAQATLRRCKIYEGAHAGVVFHHGGGGLMEDCQVYANSDIGLAVESESNPVVRRSKFYNGRSLGIAVQSAGKGIFEECEVFNNSQFGMMVRGSSDPAVSRSVFRDEQVANVAVDDKAAGSFTGCSISGGGSYNVIAAKGAATKFDNCRIVNGKDGGVLVSSGGQPLLEGCEISGNRLLGVQIQPGGNPVVRNCRIHGNGVGVTAVAGAMGTVEGSKLSGNLDGAFSLAEGAIVTRNQNVEQ